MVEGGPLGWLVVGPEGHGWTVSSRKQADELAAKYGTDDWLPKLTRAEVDQLATFNSERDRGLVHTDEYAAQMAELQRRFDQRRAT